MLYTSYVINTGPYMCCCLTIKIKMNSLGHVIMFSSLNVYIKIITNVSN